MDRDSVGRNIGGDRESGEENVKKGRNSGKGI